MSTLEARITAPQVPTPVESEPLRILKAARAKITNPDNWCRGQISNSNNTKFCALGAMWDVAGRPSTLYYTPGLLSLRVATDTIYPNSSITEVNDYLGHAAVLKCYDLAIARLEVNQ